MNTMKAVGYGSVAGLVVGFIAWALLKGTEEGESEVVSGPVPQAPAGPVRIQDLHPSIQPMVGQTLDNAAADGIQLVVTQGLRTMEEQQALYDQGRTAPGKIVTNAKPGSSWHNFGLAFDVAIVDANGNPSWPEDNALWARVGAAGKAAGLVWGGDFTQFVDRPHFEYHPGLTLSDARNGARPV
jgi:peptidoglycan L-alanyl-D-glutamate endopeptidase CwlK